MALSFECKRYFKRNKTEYVGKLSYLHLLRVDLLDLTINYLRHISGKTKVIENKELGIRRKQEEEQQITNNIYVPDKLIKLLEDISENNPENIKYRFQLSCWDLISVDYNLMIANISYLEEQFRIYNIIGAIYFINHSDIEGSYNVNEVKAIVCWLKQIMNYSGTHIKDNYRYFGEVGKCAMTNDNYSMFYLSGILEYSIKYNRKINYKLH